MKVKEEYVLQNIAGKWIVIDTNARSVNFNKILALNSTGKILWDKLEKGSDYDALVDALIDAYEIDRKLAQDDVDKFINELKELECVEDEE